MLPAHLRSSTPQSPARRRDVKSEAAFLRARNRRLLPPEYLEKGFIHYSRWAKPEEEFVRDAPRTNRWFQNERGQFKTRSTAFTRRTTLAHRRAVSMDSLFDEYLSQEEREDLAASASVSSPAVSSPSAASRATTGPSSSPKSAFETHYIKPHVAKIFKRDRNVKERIQESDFSLSLDAFQEDVQRQRMKASIWAGSSRSCYWNLQDQPPIFREPPPHEEPHLLKYHRIQTSKGERKLAVLLDSKRTFIDRQAELRGEQQPPSTAGSAFRGSPSSSPERLPFFINDPPSTAGSSGGGRFTASGGSRGAPPSTAGSAASWIDRGLFVEEEYSKYQKDQAKVRSKSRRKGRKLESRDSSKALSASRGSTASGGSRVSSAERRSRAATPSLPPASPSSSAGTPGAGGPTPGSGKRRPKV